MPSTRSPRERIATVRYYGGMSLVKLAMPYGPAWMEGLAAGYLVVRMPRYAYFLSQERGMQQRVSMYNIGTYLPLHSVWVEDSRILRTRR